MPETPQTCESIAAAARCREELERAFLDTLATPQTAESEKACRIRAVDAAARAYREAMPPLSGTENIRNFIACVAQGMLLDVFTGPESTRLLYAAPVANTATQGHTFRSKAA